MSDESKSAAEEPGEYKVRPPEGDGGDGKKEVSPKNQLIGLLLLLVVFGVLWGMMKGMPYLSTWMDEKRVAIMEGGEEKTIPETEVVLAPSQSGRVAAVLQDPSPSKERYKSQIIEQLGGPEIVEVRHLAVSDDEKRLVAALRMVGDGGEAELIEVFFERDEFGRYLSTEDSPVDVPLKLWSE